jgi:hypothetical protein
MQNVWTIFLDYHIVETDVPPNDKGFKSRADSMSPYKFDWSVFEKFMLMKLIIILPCFLWSHGSTAGGRRPSCRQKAIAVMVYYKTVPSINSNYSTVASLQNKRIKDFTIQYPVLDIKVQYSCLLPKSEVCKKSFGEFSGLAPQKWRGPAAPEIRKGAPK